MSDAQNRHDRTVQARVAARAAQGALDSLPHPASVPDAAADPAGGSKNTPDTATPIEQ